MIGKVDGKVEEYRATLVRLRETFLAYAVVTTQATVLQMRDDKSNQALDAGA
jgi:Holliday junction resolvasome RuvABC DNA-binding subunit